jgi:hypothetical protein
MNNATKLIVTCLLLPAILFVAGVFISTITFLFKKGAHNANT